MKNMGYYVYRIPSINKVGLAKDLKDRVEKQQGFSKAEYDILGFFPTLAQAREAEKELQKHYGIKEDGPDLVDMVLEKKKTSSSDATTGFRCPMGEIESFIQGGITLHTPLQGDLVFDTPEKLKWIVQNIKKSKFDGELACYVYNKAAYEFLKTIKDEQTIPTGGVDRLLDLIHDWAGDRGILDGRIETQTLKLGEEFGELQKAVLKSRSDDIKDAIGDIIVVLVSIAHFNGHTIEDALASVYDIISKRTGYTNAKGDFIKDE